MVYLIYNNGFNTYIIERCLTTYKKIEINTNGYATPYVGYLHNTNVKMLTIDGKNGTDSSCIKNANDMISNLLSDGFLLDKENVYDTNDEVQRQLGLFYKTLFCVVSSEDLSNDEIVDVQNIIKNKVL